MVRPKCGRNVVYGLIDPRNGQIRYVGKSTSGSRRPFQHGQPYSLKLPGHKTNWLRQLAAEGLRPEVVILDDSPTSLDAAEQFWIAYFRFVGADLTNHTIGGDGMVGFRHSPATKAKIAAAKRGRPPPPAAIEAARAVTLGRKLSPSHIAKMKAALSGRAPKCARGPKSPEHRAKIAESNRRTKSLQRAIRLSAHGQEVLPWPCA